MWHLPPNEVVSRAIFLYNFNAGEGNLDQETLMYLYSPGNAADLGNLLQQFVQEKVLCNQ